MIYMRTFSDGRRMKVALLANPWNVRIAGEICRDLGLDVEDPAPVVGAVNDDDHGVQGAIRDRKGTLHRLSVRLLCEPNSRLDDALRGAVTELSRNARNGHYGRSSNGRREVARSGPTVV